MSGEITLEDYKRAWRKLKLREAKRGFIAHLTAYIAVNTALTIFNLLATSEDIWFYYPLIFWGIGLAFHFVFSRPKFVLEWLQEEEAKIEYLARQMKKRTG